MVLKLTNRATSTLASPIDETETTIAVQSGDAGLFPSLSPGDWFPVTVVDAAGNMEIMRCTARSSATLTVTRAQENTTAKAFEAGSRVDVRLTVAAIMAFSQAGANLDDLTDVAEARENLGVSAKPESTTENGLARFDENGDLKDSTVTVDDDGNLAVEGDVEIDGDVTTTGKVTAGSLVGTLNANQLSGTIADARIPNLNASKINAGTFEAARIPGLDAGKITTGAFVSARLSGAYTGITGTGALTSGSIGSGFGNINVGGNEITAGRFYSYSGTVGGGNHGFYFGYGDLIRRWSMYLVANTGELQFYRYDSGGNAVGPSFTMNPNGASLFTGNVQVTGVLAKGGGTFLIDHPLDPSNRDLQHGFVEAPEYQNRYRGKVTLVDGEATVNIDTAWGMSPGTFAAINQDAWVAGLQNQTGFARVRPSPVIAGVFTIYCEDPASTDEIAWEVTAARADPFVKSGLDPYSDANGRLIVEREKEDA